MSYPIKYFELLTKFQKIYGPSVALLFEIGSFYELLAYDPLECQDEEAKYSKHAPGIYYNSRMGQDQLEQVCISLDGMNMHRRRTDKPYSINNCDTAGFPNYMYEKKKQKLLYDGFVIIRVDQINAKDIPKYKKEDVFYTDAKSKPRVVAEIVSSATEVGFDMPMAGTNNIVMIYIAYQKVDRDALFDNFALTCGVSCINVNTGINKVCELYSKTHNRTTAIQEMVRFILAQRPREVIIYVDDLPEKYANNNDLSVEDENHYGSYARYLIERLELDKVVNIMIYTNKVNPNYAKLPYQAQFFDKLFLSETLTTKYINVGNEFDPYEDEVIVPSPQKSITKTIAKPKAKIVLRKKTTTASPPVASSSSASGSAVSPLISPQSSIGYQSSPNSSSSSSPLDINSKEYIEQKIIFKQANACINKMGLSGMTYGRISYILLLQFCYQHSPNLIKNIKMPDTTWIDSNYHLILTHNTIKQLHISHEHGLGYKRSRKIRSLFDVLNFTLTKVGQRFLQERLFNPLLNPEQINLSYNMIEDMLKIPNLHNSLIQTLKGIPDIDISQRKLVTGTIKPKELYTLYNSYVKVVELYQLVLNSGSKSLPQVLLDNDKIEEFNNFLTDINDLFVIDLLKECKVVKDDEKETVMEFDQIPIRLGTSSSVNELHTTVIDYEEHLTQICQHLNDIIGKTGKLDYRIYGKTKKSDKVVGFGIVITEAKSKKLKTDLRKIDQELCGVISFVKTRSKNEFDISSTIIDSLTAELTIAKSQLRKDIYDVYSKFIAKCHKFSFYDSVSNMIATLDFIQSGCSSAAKYKYYKPRIVPVDKDESSFLDIKGLRHPVIERIINHPYITNDISLGYTNSKRGLLLYGGNKTGKTSLARAVGLAIVMAQAGLYTACQLSYRPFCNIFTRITGEDNMMNGESSFAVEGYELNIFDKGATNKSLVLGDELCKGTDIKSGMAITLEALERLLDKSSCFIFATHMHELLKTEDFAKIGADINVSHLDMYCDEESGQLIIKRNMMPGEGSTMYGIEIAKSLGFDDEFIQGALDKRRRIVGDNEFLSTNSSRYNKTIYKDRCILCGSKEHLHVHHIVEQYKADEQGYIGTMHKNVASNLMVICEKCHQIIHSNNIEFNSVETAEGSALI